MLASAAGSGLPNILGCALGLGSRTVLFVGPTIPPLRVVLAEKVQILVVVKVPFLSGILDQGGLLILGLRFRAKKVNMMGPRFFQDSQRLREMRDNRSGAGRALCVAGFVSGPCAQP